MNILYGAYQRLATGGSIGNALFFFCSGFTLFLGRNEGFDTWYKRRISRIYPSVFAWAIILAFAGKSSGNMKEILLHGGGWFVSCIMLHYIIIYYIRKHLARRIKLIFGITCIVVIVLYIFEDRHVDNFNMYNGKYISAYFSWSKWLLFTLLGAIVGKSNEKPTEKTSFAFKYVLYLFICIALYYIIMLIGSRDGLYRELQICSLIPLLFIPVWFLRVCNMRGIIELSKTNYIGTAINVISTLTLEIYITQGVIFSIIGNKLNRIFPLNIVLVFLIITIAAYIVKTLGKIFLQTFSESPYDWKSIVTIKRRE